MDAADVSDDGMVNILDLVQLIDRLYFLPALFPEPYPIPGFDMTDDDYFCSDVVITPGEKTGDLLSVGTVDAEAGADVLIPIYLTHAESVEGFQLVIAYDPGEFTPYNHTPDQPGGLDFTNSILTELYDQEIFFLKSRYQ